jgi:cytochrome P450
MEGGAQHMTNDSPRLKLPVRREDPIRVPEVFSRLREEQPVCPVSLPTGDAAWLVTRHEDLKMVLADRRFSRAAVCAEDAPRTQAVRPNPDSILNMDPPRHSRIRKLAATAFTQARMDQLRPVIEEIVTGLLDDMAAMTPPVDLIACFGLPLPLRIICHMLGVPFKDHEKLEGWTARIMSSGSTAEQIAVAYIEMRGYFTQLIEDKRRAPGDDFLSALAAQSGQEGGLTPSELLNLGTFFLVAGHETSTAVITSAVLNLLRHPEQARALREDPSLMPAAIEEMIRLGIPGVSPFVRIALSDVEIHGVAIGKGDAVVANYETALRDERVFEDAETFNIRRKPVSQVFFGHGPHFCLGAPVARAEIEIGIGLLLARFPALALAIPPEQLAYRHEALLGNWEVLPVTW